MKCRGTIPNLNMNSHDWVVFSDALDQLHEEVLSKEQLGSNQQCCVLQYGSDPLGYPYAQGATTKILHYYYSQDLILYRCVAL